MEFTTIINLNDFDDQDDIIPSSPEELSEFLFKHPIELDYWDSNKPEGNSFSIEKRFPVRDNAYIVITVDGEYNSDLPINRYNPVLKVLRPDHRFLEEYKKYISIELERIHKVEWRIIDTFYQKTNVQHDYDYEIGVLQLTISFEEATQSDTI